MKWVRAGGVAPGVGWHTHERYRAYGVEMMHVLEKFEARLGTCLAWLWRVPMAGWALAFVCQLQPW